MNRSRLNLAAVVLALTAGWGTYVVAGPVPYIVPPYPSTSAAGAGTACGAPATRDASASKSGPAGERPQGARADDGCAGRGPAVARARAAQARHKPLLWSMGTISALMLVIAIFVRTWTTRPWAVRALLGLVMLQVAGFVLAFNATSVLTMSSQVNVLPVVNAGLVLMAQLWCLRVFVDFEMTREFQPRAFDGYHLVADEQAAAEAAARALAEGADAISSEMPSWVQEVTGEGDEQPAAPDQQQAGAIDEPAPAPTPRKLPTDEEDEEEDIWADAFTSALAKKWESESDDEGGDEPRATTPAWTIAETAQSDEQDEEVDIWASAFESALAHKFELEDDTGFEAEATEPEPDAGPTPRTLDLPPFEIDPDAGDLFEVSGPLGAGMLGGWIDCTGQSIVRVQIAGARGGDVEMLLADESGEVHAVPEFEPTSGTARFALPAGRWYAAVRGDEDNDAAVTLTVTHSLVQVA